jgi:hypothetical protein
MTRRRSRRPRKRACTVSKPFTIRAPAGRSVATTTTTTTTTRVHPPHPHAHPASAAASPADPSHTGGDDQIKVDYCFSS